MIEEACIANNNSSGVLLIGHSNGGPTIYSFQESMEKTWFGKYVDGMIGLSGNYLSQMNAIKKFLPNPEGTSG